MKKLLITLFLILSVGYAELPSFQCEDQYEATMINFKGELKPQNKATSHSSKLNVSIVLEEKDGQKYVNFLRVNGNDLQVTYVKNSYIYAVEFTKGGMHTWTLFDNVDEKTYITLSKTYNFLGAPMTSYSLYSCKQVNNTFENIVK